MNHSNKDGTLVGGEWLTNGAIKTSGGMEKTIAAVRNYVAAFLDVNLNAKPGNTLLEGQSSDYPEVEVTTQTQNQCPGTDGKPAK